MFAASFVLGGVTVNFGALVMNHEDKAGALREITFDTHFLQETDWNSFRSFICWNMEVIPMPWGNTVEVLIKGGPGPGTLTMPALNPTTYTAWLEEATRTWHNHLTGHSTGKAKFLLNAQ